MQIFRANSEPRRSSPTYAEGWEQADKGLILCWERGRELAEQSPELAKAARAGELPVLSWKGGVEKPLRPNRKFGSLFYVAMWQGLRGDNLDINSSQEIQIVCAKTQCRVTFTRDITRLSEG